MQRVGSRVLIESLQGPGNDRGNLASDFAR